MKLQKRKTHFGIFLFPVTKNFLGRVCVDVSKVKKFFDLMENSTFLIPTRKNPRAPLEYLFWCGWASLGRPGAAWDSIMNRYANIVRRRALPACALVDHDLNLTPEGMPEGVRV